MALRGALLLGASLLLLGFGGLSLWLYQPAQAALGSVQGCSAYSGLPEGWPANPLAAMQQIKGGEFTPGSYNGYDDECPLGAVSVGDFWIDRTEVTQAQFAAFVAATGYLTEAEREGGGALFAAPNAEQLNPPVLSWWRYVPGANWRQPDGQGDVDSAPGNLPVALVTLADAQAYAQWLGNQLPSEAEWEYAARGGSSGEPLDDTPLDDQGRPTANYWQGAFPLVDTAEDGYAGRAPVGCFAANAYGLYDMIGNLWEWTADRYSGAVQGHANGDPSTLRLLPVAAEQHQVIKGGSFLCAANYCMRYRVAARERQEGDLATAHVGFRTIRRSGPEPVAAQRSLTQ
ncbi:formylglycine-generating enzyme family protein [Pseudomonas peli]|uniref:formylglycine-generating enzyme family protein n=1 Tax=Pseudomonas peli TaxID=592361 RepID=UPI003D31C3F7